jgi:hypothetical protein
MQLHMYLSPFMHFHALNLWILEANFRLPKEVHCTVELQLESIFTCRVSGNYTVEGSTVTILDLFRVLSRIYHI